MIGDLDSVEPETLARLEACGTAIVHDPDQDSTDFGKSVCHVRGRSSSSDDDNKPFDIIAVGGLGGRVDQGLSQIHHLYLFQRGQDYDDGRMYLVSEQSLTFLLKPGRHRIHVRGDGEGGKEEEEEEEQEVFGKHVGIVPIGTTARISTRGLQWDVEDWETEFGGQLSTSNHVLPESKIVEVITNKDVVFTIALRDRGLDVED